MAYLPKGRSRAKKRVSALMHNYEQSMKRCQAARQYSRADYDGSQEEEC